MNKYFKFFNNQLTLSNGPGKYRITEDSLWLSSVIPQNLDSYLDVGCGSGVISLILSMKNKSASIVGLDIQKEMIDAAKNHLELNKIKNIDLINANLFDINEGGYDCVFSNPPFLCVKKTESTNEKFRKIAHFQEDINSFINKMISLANPMGVVCIIVHKTTQAEVRNLLKGLYCITEIELINKNDEPKRVIYIIDKSKKDSSWVNFQVDSTSEIIREDILVKHKSLIQCLG